MYDTYVEDVHKAVISLPILGDRLNHERAILQGREARQARNVETSISKLGQLVFHQELKTLVRCCPESQGDERNQYQPLKTHRVTSLKQSLS